MTCPACSASRSPRGGRRRSHPARLFSRARLLVACCLIAALACDVELYLFDEPTDGLDPLMAETFRECVTELAADGRTVLLSSHALGEVETTADHVLVLAHGRLLRSSMLAELRSEADIGSRVRTPDATRLGLALDAAGYTFRLAEDGLVVDAAPEEVGAVAAAHGVVLHGLGGTAGLEHAFFRIVQDADPTRQRESAPKVVS